MHLQLFSRVVKSDPNWDTGAFCRDAGIIDPDFAGLGARIGLYMQCVAVTLAILTAHNQTLAAIPAAVITCLTYNIVLSMKMAMVVFGTNPNVQEFWAVQGQLWLLTSIISYGMLFGKWKGIGHWKELLLAKVTVYNNAQGLYFWLHRYKLSDEVVCATADSEFLGAKLFYGDARRAMVAAYIFQLVVLLPLATYSYLRKGPTLLNGLL